MIDFHTFENVHLEDVAEYGRAKKGHVYPAGTSTLQISATRGQIGYLNEPGKVETKHVAIMPFAGINPKYFNVVLHKNIEEFLHKYQADINIQEHDVGMFPIQLHNVETQKAIVDMYSFIEREERQVQQDISNLMDLKKRALEDLLI